MAYLTALVVLMAIATLALAEGEKTTLALPEGEAEGENATLALPEGEKAIQARQEACSLPVKKGPCMAEMPRFFYNSETGKCEEFQYGGCEGNENNFETLNECEKACDSSSDSS